MDWKKHVETQLDEGAISDFIFGKIPTHTSPSRTTTSPSPQEEVAAAPKPDRFAALKGYGVPEDKQHVADHVKTMLSMAHAADNAGVESTLDNHYPDRYSGGYKYDGPHDSATLAQHLGASIMTAHAGLPSEDEEAGAFLHHVSLSASGGLRAHYHNFDTSDNRPKTAFVHELG